MATKVKMGGKIKKNNCCVTICNIQWEFNHRPISSIIPMNPIIYKIMLFQTLKLILTCKIVLNEE